VTVADCHIVYTLTLGHSKECSLYASNKQLTHHIDSENPFFALAATCLGDLARARDDVVNWYALDRTPDMPRFVTQGAPKMQLYTPFYITP
jgi:hypothetical protein